MRIDHLSGLGEVGIPYPLHTYPLSGYPPPLDIDTPPPYLSPLDTLSPRQSDRMTDARENTTFPQVRWQLVKIL